MVMTILDDTTFLLKESTTQPLNHNSRPWVILQQWMTKKLKTQHHFRSVSCIPLIKLTSVVTEDTRGNAVKRSKLLKVIEQEHGNQNLRLNNLFILWHRKMMTLPLGKTLRVVELYSEM